MAKGTSLAERFSQIFTQPAVPVGMVVLAGVIFGLGEMQSRPIRAQAERERNLQVQREGAVEKALSQYTETMKQDNEVERRAWENRLLQKDDQMQGVMEQIAGWMKAEGWKGELKPRMEEGVTPELSDLRRIGLGVELVSPRSVSGRVAESDQVRLLRILRKISGIPAPHVVRRLEVDQNLDGEMRARVELEFFRLKTDG
jgi:uncharacterized membrane protein